MSVIKETILVCDGGHQCPMASTFAEGDQRNLNAKCIRASAKRDGWIQRGSKDYCPECAKRLSIKSKKL